MAQRKVLHMQFNAEDGPISMSVPYIKDELKEADIKTLMDAIIAKNIFGTKNGDLKKAAGASITTTDIEKIKF